MDTQLNALQTIAKPPWCTVHVPLKVQGSLVYVRRVNPRQIRDGQPSWAEASMIGRREWFQKAITHARAAWIASRAGGFRARLWGKKFRQERDTQSLHGPQPALSTSKS